jgi:hypothetical protein
MGNAARNPWLRRSLTAFVSAVFAASLTTATAAAAGQTPGVGPLNGVFENCDPEQVDVCTQRLSDAQQMGFGMVMNYSALKRGPEVARQYAETAQGMGLQVAWPIFEPGWFVGYRPSGNDMLDEYWDWGQSCGCESNADLLRYMVTTLAQIPNTWGWYSADDLQLRGTDAVGAVTDWTHRLKALAPGESTLISIWDTMGAYRNAADYVAQESYPLGLPSNLGPVSPWKDIASLASDTQRMTPGRTAFILQGFSWGDNVWNAQGVGGCSGGEGAPGCLSDFRYPDPGEQLRQRQTILRNSRPALLLWYSLDGTIGPFKPHSGPEYNEPSPAEAANRKSSLAATVLAPPPQTRACVRVRRHRSGWVLDARASQGLGGMQRARWQHPGWRQQGRGLRIKLRAAGGHGRRSIALVVRDRYEQTAKVTAQLGGGRGMRCERASSTRQRW